MTNVPLKPSAPPKKSGSRGCLIGVGIVGGLLFLSCVVLSVLGVSAANTPQGKKVLTAMRKGATVAVKGMNAPGTDEVRALGCPQAMVMNTQDFMDIASDFLDGGAAKREAFDFDLVLCQGQMFGELPGCDEVARVYAAAAKPVRSFVVTVQKQNQSSKPQCTGRYDVDGQYLGTFGRK